MKGKKILGLLLAALLFTSKAGAWDDVTVTVGSETVPAFVETGVTYVQLTALLEAMGGWETQWDREARIASAETDLFTLDVPAQRNYVLADGFSFETGRASLLRYGRTYVPLRSVANLLGAQVDFVDWDTPMMVQGAGPAACTEEDFDWLCRIISAESQGESLMGQIAVGNVILNRVSSGQFPDMVKSVVFDRKNGVQFEPVANQTIYNEPTEQSVLAARLALAGVDAAGESLYFFNPALSQGQWVRANRTYYATIGCHMFFK
ncbi:MAG: cell wall hydrolase [Oscillospiraceae bacterium]|nr:cell wall hydrolase [Oscillospiraceae bacterium]